ncbi:Alpha/Beta hydrolase protein [Cercophora scortea]|uniref:Alpha/Beta hydrolase protein n=1 Tax=Cercophora scortea TaxID=314031 RepID=A0AAE0MGS9_9PEZI|nr:Alpha/Beta hydrolase protein [Cercophora scortea]
MSSSLTFLLFFVFHIAVVLCSPLPLGVNFEKRDTLPILTLPYASYRAATYRASSDIYIFRNIRYAAPPVGNLRWAKPAPPLTNTTLQDGSYGPKCIQSAPAGLNIVGKGNASPVGAAINQFLGGIPIPLFSGGSEDCLFLDLYVPAKALKNPSLKLPVVVWIYGGAYLFGSKDTLQPQLPFYDGSGMMGQASNNMIFVAMNYRLGAYGFLAGTTMEREALPNAGLHDQRAALQWVRDYIGLVGGDPSRVTAMGESAGASSIMHHLVAQGGGLDPLFSKAILQSPAFQMTWDRAGAVETTFQDFAALAGCKGKGLACLRAADPAALLKANVALNQKQVSGTFAVGPTPDGSFIRQIPLLELSSGKFWPIESMILSHVADEASVFVSGSIQNDAQFTSFLGAVFPNYTRSTGVNAKVEAFYPPLTGSAAKSTYSTQTARVTAFLRDSCFTCNVRYLTAALGDSKVWNMQYSVFPGQHATDLIPTFYSTSAITGSSFLDSIALLMAPVVAPLVTGISTAMQSYFASYITTGNPNTKRAVWNFPPTVQWNHPVSGDSIQGVVNVGDWGFGTVSDDQTGKAACGFWEAFARSVTALGGYAPPGEGGSGNGNAPLGLAGVDVVGDASRNYRGGNV